jgi:hypothetical protein
MKTTFTPKQLSLATACAIATSDVEHAVWTLTAGPVRFRRWATRVAM